ncbi:MAG: LLM class oxidoreductase [Pseudomonadota bacterium]
MTIENSTLKQPPPDSGFNSINAGFDAVFQRGRLTLGLVVPIETYATSAVPAMERHIERAQLAEALGFKALWLRDVPFNVPSFGDAGQTLDPFVYLGALAMQTSRIALGVASIILPLRHPAHVAKAAASADVLSDGRVLLGIASGDRPEEYPAIGVPYEQRGALYRECYDYIRGMGECEPRVRNTLGEVGGGMDMLPKPAGARLPLLVTGSSQQSIEWIAEHADGWMTYPRHAEVQSRFIENFRALAQDSTGEDKPVMEPLYVDLAPDPDCPPSPIHLGLRLGVNALREFLTSRQAIGVNHVALNLRFNRAGIETTLEQLADHLLPEFNYQGLNQ